MAQSFIWRGQSVFEADGVGPGGKARCVASFRKYKRGVKRPAGVNYAVVVVSPHIGLLLPAFMARTTDEARGLINGALHAGFPQCEITRNGTAV